jgi:hypothetical protein
LLLQAPLASQVPVQASSSLLITATQVPPPPVQAWQAPQDEAVQHLPSTQLPVAHSPGPLQSVPGRDLQAPVASQVLPPTHLSSSADFTGAQVPPPEQVSQTPSQVVLQQTPSTHLPLVQASGAVQAAPRACLGKHLLALQNSPAEQGLLAEQPPMQMVPAQPPAPQLTVVWGWQAPLPSQTERE